MTKSCESTAAEKHSSSGQCGNASNQKRLKTELGTPTATTAAQYAQFQPSSRDVALLSEFNQESETVFMQDDVCYEHYKEMQRDQK